MKTDLRILGILLLGLFAISMVGCERIEGLPSITPVEKPSAHEDWVGTWSLETIDGESLKQLFEDTLEDEFEEPANISIGTNNWTFNSDGTWKGNLVTKFTSIDMPVNISNKVAGTYRLSGSNYTLTTTSVTEVITTPEGVETFTDENEDEETGTWHRDGNTLSLSSDTDGIAVFKKK